VVEWWSVVCSGSWPYIIALPYLADSVPILLEISTLTQASKTRRHSRCLGGKVPHCASNPHPDQEFRKSGRIPHVTFLLTMVELHLHEKGTKSWRESWPNAAKLSANRRFLSAETGRIFGCRSKSGLTVTMEECMPTIACLDLSLPSPFLRYNSRRLRYNSRRG
jgi:hypothetical protein